MGQDPLFHTELDGVRFNFLRPEIVPGSVIGAGVSWTEVDRFGKIAISMTRWSTSSRRRRTLWLRLSAFPWSAAPRRGE
jgi:hypothetical protein